MLGRHITENLKWSTHTDCVVKAHQYLFNPRRLKKCGLSPKTFTNFYRHTIESILSGCFTAWYDNCTSHNCKTLQRVNNAAPGGKLPALQDTYITQCHRRAKKIIKDNNHPSHCLFTPLPSRSRDRETEKQLLSQGHQTVKQTSLTQRGCCLNRDLKSLATLINGSLVTLIMAL